jgi:hypothetical protein
VSEDIVEGHVVEVEARPSTDLVLPTGELVMLDDPISCALALTRVREMESFLKEAKGAITQALVEEAERRGNNTIECSDGTQIQVKRSYDLEWDTEKLEQELMALGMPEERIREIIVPKVEYVVKAVEANKAAKANPEYAKVIESAKTKTERRPTISLPRG